METLNAPIVPRATTLSRGLPVLNALVENTRMLVIRHASLVLPGRTPPQHLALVRNALLDITRLLRAILVPYALLDSIHLPAPPLAPHVMLASTQLRELLCAQDAFRATMRPLETHALNA